MADLARQYQAIHLIVHRDLPEQVQSQREQQLGHLCLGHHPSGTLCSILVSCPLFSDIELVCILWISRRKLPKKLPSSFISLATALRRLLEQFVIERYVGGQHGAAYRENAITSVEALSLGRDVAQAQRRDNYEGSHPVVNLENF